MSRNVIIIGAGGHALVVADALHLSGHSVVAYVDTVSPERRGTLFNTVPILGSYEELISETHRLGASVAFGIGDCETRFRLLFELSRLGLQLETVIHPQAIVSRSAVVAEGAYIGPNSVIESQCIVGAGTIVNCGACVCHEVILGRAVAVCPGVKIGGQSCIGDRTWLGIGASIKDKVAIGSGSLIGAGAAVVSDISDNVLAVGVPARVIRAIEHDS